MTPRTIAPPCRFIARQRCAAAELHVHRRELDAACGQVNKLAEWILVHDGVWMGAPS